MNQFSISNDIADLLIIYFIIVLSYILLRIAVKSCS
ncbi:MAG: hypothetical protein ACTS85_03830 [Arsenophonus sp. NC-PG7-MAG3]